MTGAPGAVELGGHRGVVVAAAVAHRVGLPGLAEFFQCVLANRLQHSVSRSEVAVFSYDK